MVLSAETYASWFLGTWVVLRHLRLIAGLRWMSRRVRSELRRRPGSLIDLFGEKCLPKHCLINTDFLPLYKKKKKASRSKPPPPSDFLSLFWKTNKKRREFGTGLLTLASVACAMGVTLFSSRGCSNNLFLSTLFCSCLPPTYVEVHFRVFFFFFF